MFDTIILLADPAEHSLLTSILVQHNPRLTVWPVQTPAHLAALETERLRRARLIAFASPTIVPGAVLDRLGYGGYNFHPGPPRYPGWAPAHFALYDQATEFGVTAHVMIEEVDAGPIVGVALFPVPAGMEVAGLQELAYSHLAKMFCRLAPVLATLSAPLPHAQVPWSGTKNSRRGYRALCEIPLTIREDELHRRIRIFGANHFGIAPTIRLHGVRFQAVTAEDERGAADTMDATS
jgi:methionyl-tRNA formyltransferase